MNRLPAIMIATLLLLPATAGAGQKTARFLSGPADGTPLEISRAYLEKHHAELGLAVGDLVELVVQSQYVSRHTGVTHVSLRQRLGGVEVVNGDIGVHLMPDGRIVHLTSRFVSDLAGRVNAHAPAVEAEAAILRAAEHLGLAPGEPPSLLEVEGGTAMAMVFDGAGISLDPIPARLMYLPRGAGEVRLVWSLVIRRVGASDWWNLFVDAIAGEVLEKLNWTVSERPAVALSRPGAPPAAGGENQAAEDCASNCYRVFALPKESPSDGDRTLEDDPADAVASPFGWHDTDGAVGAEFTDSRGNNVEAQTDLDGNNVFTAGTDVRSQGGANLIFDDPIDLGQHPSTYREAAVTNLFYYNNIMHDVTYQYGFDEPSGNFQQNNYGNGGAGGDPVQADAQDISGTNNATFSTPPDGSDPRMQMFVWTLGQPNRDGALDNGLMGHEYGHGISNRLVGGPANVNCLFNSEQPGEGWSDWWTLVLSAVPSDTAELPRGVLTYVLFQPPDGPGIRSFPYTTDLNVNPQTYADVGDATIPHGVGEIWNALLWEMYWLLVPRLGFDTDLYTGSGGNNLAIQLVVDGLKMAACSPGFVDGRDAIVAADVALTGGANECEIWTAFAKRGVGFSADQGSSQAIGDETEAFDFPPGVDPDCALQVFADGFESGDTSAWSGALP